MVLFLVLYGISVPSSIVVVSICISTTVQEHSIFSTPSAAFIVCRHFDGEGNGTPLQYFCLENPMDEEPGGLQSMASLELDTTERLHFQFSLSCIGEGNGNPLQCSCLENPRDGVAWWAAVSGVAQSQTRLNRLSRHFDDGRSDWYRLPCSSKGKESAFNVGDQGSVPGLGSCSGEGNGNPLQYSCLENFMDREVWWATVHGVTMCQT